MPDSPKRWFGNDQTIDSIKFILNNGRSGSHFIIGPDGLGKRSCIESMVGSLLNELDILSVTSNKDSLRDVMEFINSPSITSDFKAVVVDGLEKQNFATQDSWLKIVEEPRIGNFLFYVISDEGALVDALRSRIRTKFVFKSLNRDEMVSFAEDSGEVDFSAIDNSFGIPSIYLKIRNNPNYTHMFSLLNQAIFERRNLLIENLPILCSEAKEDHEIRRIISKFIRQMCSNSLTVDSINRIRPALKFAGTICRSSSCDVELHWWRMSSDLLSLA
jgi:hypothetical protein